MTNEFIEKMKVNGVRNSENATPEAIQSLAEENLFMKLKIEHADLHIGRILQGRFHIGNDENGNVFGPPDKVMTEIMLREVLKILRAPSTVQVGE